MKNCYNLLFLTILLAVTAYAGKSDRKVVKQAVNPAAQRIFDYALPDENNFYVTDGADSRLGLDRTKNRSAAIGWKIGDTYYDYFSNGSAGRQLGWGQSASCPWTLHFTWMYLDGPVLADRAIHYNAWDGATGTPSGIYTDIQLPGDYAGYPRLAVTDDNRAVVTCHNFGATASDYRIHTYWQDACDSLGFGVSAKLPDSLNDLGATCPGPEDYVIWPRVAIQHPPGEDRVTHLIGIASCGGSGASNFSYYQYSGESGGSWTQGFVLDTIQNGDGYAIAADENGNVGIAWVARAGTDTPGCDTCSINAESAQGIGYDRVLSDLYIVVNRNYGTGELGTFYDGTTNYWENRINLTKYDPTDPNGNRYPQPDISALWSTAGEFHLAFVATYYNGTFTYESRIRHWGENLGFLTDGTAKLRTVATAEWEPLNCNPGAFTQNQARVSLSECDGKFYTSWIEYNSPDSVFNPNQDDCAARAFSGQMAGAANGDLFLSVSNDDGLTWDPARNLTQTYGGPTGNPNGACDPAGIGGPCPSETFLSSATQGGDYAVIGPGTSNILPADGQHNNNAYIDLAYLDDIDPGGAIFDYGSWYSTDYLWARIPCVEPVYEPIFNISSTSFSYPNYVRQCTQKNLIVDIVNTGNAPLFFTFELIEDPGVYSGWLGQSGLDDICPTCYFDFETGEILLNVGGMICESFAVRETGRVLFHTNEPLTHTFEIEMYVADTVILPVWDTVQTYCEVALTVSNNGGMGNHGESGVTLDYSNGPNEWRPDDYDTYMYDGSTVIGWVDGADTIVNLSLYPISIADSVSLVPNGTLTHTSTAWANIVASGEFMTNDSSIGILTKYYAPTQPDSCGFVVKETKVYSKTGNRTGLMIGEVIDWDIPSDSAIRDNSGGNTNVSGYTVVYQQGVEIPGYDDSLESVDGGWDNDQRYGGVMYLGGFVTVDGIDYSTVNSDPYGTYVQPVIEWLPYVDPPYVWSSLYQLHSNSGMNLGDSVTDLMTGVTFAFDTDLAVGDTLVFYTAYATALMDGYPAKSLSDFQATLAKAAFFAENYLTGWIPNECQVAGDFNHDGVVDIADLTAMVDFMFGNGLPPVIRDEADVNGDSAVDISDLTYRVDFMFAGGPEPICGTTGWK